MQKLKVWQHRIFRQSRILAPWLQLQKLPCKRQRSETEIQAFGSAELSGLAMKGFWSQAIKMDYSNAASFSSHLQIVSGRKEAIWFSSCLASAAHSDSKHCDVYSLQCDKQEGPPSHSPARAQWQSSDTLIHHSLLCCFSKIWITNSPLKPSSYQCVKCAAEAHVQVKLNDCYQWQNKKRRNKSCWFKSESEIFLQPPVQEETQCC